MATHEITQVERARTQNLFREVNERVDELNETRAVNGELLCECATKECLETITLTRAEYEDVRRVPTHFFTLPGHEVPEIERVVARREGYIVVEKHGEAGKAAVRFDPRRRGGSDEG